MADDAGAPYARDTFAAQVVAGAEAECQGTKIDFMGLIVFCRVVTPQWTRLGQYCYCITKHDLSPKSVSRTSLLTECRHDISELAATCKQKVLISIDEAHLLRRDVLSELHTLLNFTHEGSNFLTFVPCGQTSLIEHLQYRSATPLASRVMARALIKPMTQPELVEYINLHLRVA